MFFLPLFWFQFSGSQREPSLPRSVTPYILAQNTCRNHRFPCLLPLPFCTARGRTAAPAVPARGGGLTTPPRGTPPWRHWTPQLCGLSLTRCPVTVSFRTITPAVPAAPPRGTRTSWFALPLRFLPCLALVAARVACAHAAARWLPLPQHKRTYILPNTALPPCLHCIVPATLLGLWTDDGLVYVCGLPTLRFACCLAFDAYVGDYAQRRLGLAHVLRPCPFYVY